MPMSPIVPGAAASPAWIKELNTRETRLFLPFLIFVSLICLLIRIEDTDYIVESLWVEDGEIFINQAHELGLKSLWVPYNGFLFSYHRIVSLLFKPIPLAAIPYIFFFAWLMAFVPILVVLKNRAKFIGLDELMIAFLVCAISLQPNHGEPFFNLNHSHYFLGIALAFYVCIPSRDRTSVSTIAFLTLSSLSGPFSTFLIATLAAQLAILRDFHSRKLTYTVVPICGLIQLILMLSSERANETTINASIPDWFDAISSFLLFGGGNKLTLTSAIMLWFIILTFFFVSMKHQARSPTDRAVWISLLSAALTASVLYLSFMLSFGDFLATMSPLDMGSRYFLIPYSLVFFAAMACTKNYRTAQTAVMCLISIICGVEFLYVDRSDRASSSGLLSHSNLQWTAFTKFREIKPDIVIPVNPSWPIYPTLPKVAFKNLDAANAASLRAPAPILLGPQQIESEKNSGDLEATAGPALYIDITDLCEKNRYVALEVEIWRARMGWAKIYWGQPEHFEPGHSLERFYPDGNSVMQFAFRRNTSDNLIRFHPAEGVLESPLVRTFGRYRESASRDGQTVAEPTKPGGEVKVEAIRLFCLDGPQAR